MNRALSPDAVLLVLDTCGEEASLSLHRGPALIGEEVLAGRAASASLLHSLRTLLSVHAVQLEELRGIGVVHGPGSFTGVRVGLACAKGLCEAMALRCAAVSRLAVLAHAAGLDRGCALLPAGRGQVYARVCDDQGQARENMVDLELLLPQLASQVVAVADAGLAERLQGRVADLRMVALTAQRAIAPVLACLEQGGVDLAVLDANYVRNESAIFGTPRSAETAPSLLA